MTENKFGVITNWCIYENVDGVKKWLNFNQVADLLNELNDKTKKLEKENLDLSEELDYFKTKCASLETGYIKAQDEGWRLEKSKMDFANELGRVIDENEQLKAQLYCDDEEGICNHCKHHYLVKDDEAELGYYNSRCKKGHYECARVSLKHCEDFEKGDFE